MNIHDVALLVCVCAGDVTRGAEYCKALLLDSGQGVFPIPITPPSLSDS